MAGILGLGEGGASALNQEIIDKLKDADTESTVNPITKKIDAITSFEEGEEGEQFKLLEIKLKVADLITSMSLLDLNTTTGTVFDAKSSSVSGTSATFASDNMSLLSEGITKVNVTQVAQKDIYQTDTFSNKDIQVADGNNPGDLVAVSVAGTPIYQSDKTSTATSTDLVGAGTFTITPAGGSAVTITTTDTTTWDSLKTMIDADSTLNASFVNNRLSITSIDGTKELTIADTDGSVSSTLGISSGSKFTTEGKTYEELATSINANSKLNASVEQVGDDSYRLVIKSEESGTANTLTISQTAVDLKLGESANHILTAQNLNATIDGVDYDTSSNQIKTAGDLTITAAELGKSSLSISKNTDLVVPAVKEFVEKYNELVTLIDTEKSSPDSPINDMSSLQTMMSSIKDILFGSYGEQGKLNIFAISMDATSSKAGLSLDKTGKLALDETIFASTISSNPDNIKSLFVGTSTKEGLGTKLKDFLGGLSKRDGILDRYDTNMDKRLEKLNEEKDKMTKTLDTRYASMASDFASYGSVITQMEAQFSGMKMMIEQSIASK